MILLLRSVFKVRDGTWPVLVRKIGLKFLPKGSPALPDTKENESLRFPGTEAQFRLAIQELKTVRIESCYLKLQATFSGASDPVA